MQYRTKDGDVLDAICDRHYGAGNYRVEDVSEANRNLASIGPVLPSGIVIELPELAEIAAAPTDIVRLWS